MKKPLFITALIATVSLFAFVNSPEIGKCYISFKKASGLTVSPPVRIPAENDHSRMLATAKSDTKITIADGYTVLYNNKRKSPFINLKVELSLPQNYAADTANVLENLSYLNSKSTDMQSDKLLTMHYNGFNIYGLSRKSLDAGSTLGIYAMFPGDNTIVYFYFNNLSAETRTLKSIEDYQGLRNDFIGQYTAYLKNCSGK